MPNNYVDLLASSNIFYYALAHAISKQLFMARDKIKLDHPAAADVLENRISWLNFA